MTQSGDKSDLNVADNCGMGAVQESTPQEKRAAGEVVAATAARIARKRRHSVMPRYEHQLEVVLLALGVKNEASGRFDYSEMMARKGRGTQWQK